MAFLQQRHFAKLHSGTSQWFFKEESEWGGLPRSEVPWIILEMLLNSAIFSLAIRTMQACFKANKAHTMSYSMILSLRQFLQLTARLYLLCPQEAVCVHCSR